MSPTMPPDQDRPPVWSRQQARTFLLATLTVSVPTWTIAFNFGVYQDIFFEHTMYIWVASFTTLVASFFIPHKQSPIDAPGKIVLALPTIAVLLNVAYETQGLTALLDILILSLQVVILLVCLPFIFQMIASFANPELVEVGKRRLTIPLGVVVIIVGVLGYLVGTNHAWFMTCHDFEVSGNMVPTNCRR